MVLLDRSVFGGRPMVAVFQIYADFLPIWIQTKISMRIQIKPAPLLYYALSLSLSLLYYIQHKFFSAIVR
jgi:hypothetical protein